MTAKQTLEAQAPLDLLKPLLRVPCDPANIGDPERWQQIRTAARTFGVSALVAWNALPFVPAAEKLWCHRTLSASWAHHERNLRALDRVVGALRDANVDPIALKGPALGLRYYDPPFLRKPSSDLDLGVRESELEPASRALIQRGFVAASHAGDALAVHHHVTFSHDDGARIELHFRLSHGPLGPRIDDFFERSISYTLPTGTVVRILDPADEMFHLALHLASDRFGSFFHLYEMWRLWRQQPDSVRDAVIRKAVDRNFRGVFSLIELAFQSTWGEAFLPPDLRWPGTWLGFAVNRNLYRQFEANMVRRQGQEASSRLRGRWLDLRITDRPVDAARLAFLVARIGFREVYRAGRSIFTGDGGHDSIRRE